MIGKGCGKQSKALFTCWVLSDSLWPHGLQHARFPCPSPSQSLLKLMSTESVMPSSHLILCHPLLLLPSSIRKVNHLFTVVFRPLPTMPTMWGPGFNPWVGKIPWRRKWQPTPVFLPGEFHGWWNLVGYSPWGRKELDTTERLHFHSHFRPLQSFIYENVTRENKNRVLPEGLWLLEL